MAWILKVLCLLTQECWRAQKVVGELCLRDDYFFGSVEEGSCLWFLLLEVIIFLPRFLNNFFPRVVVRRRGEKNKAKFAQTFYKNKPKASLKAIYLMAPGVGFEFSMNLVLFQLPIL